MIVIEAASRKEVWFVFIDRVTDIEWRPMCKKHSISFTHRASVTICSKKFDTLFLSMVSKDPHMEASCGKSVKMHPLLSSHPPPYFRLCPGEAGQQILYFHRVWHPFPRRLELRRRELSSPILFRSHKLHVWRPVQGRVKVWLFTHSCRVQVGWLRPSLDNAETCNVNEAVMLLLDISVNRCVSIDTIFSFFRRLCSDRIFRCCWHILSANVHSPHFCTLRVLLPFLLPQIIWRT